MELTRYSYLADTDEKATVIDPEENETSYHYSDSAYPSLPTEIDDPANEAVVHNTYDANGNLCDTGPVPTTSCTAESGDTYNTYDAYAGLLANKVTSTDPNGNRTSYAYTNSAFPHLVTEMTEPDNTENWFYTYNDDGQEIQTEDPEGNYIATNYDADGRKCWQVQGTSTASCGSAPSGIGNSSWTYGFNGTVSTMSDNIGTSQAATTTYTDDPSGNETAVTDDNSNTVDYTYNAASQVSCIEYPNSTGTGCGGTASTTNPIVKYGYDTEGRLKSTTDWLGKTTTYVYSSDGLNNLTSINYPTDSPDSVTYGYNPDSQVYSQSYSGPDVAPPIVPNQSWGFNLDGLIDSATQVEPSGGTLTTYALFPTVTVHVF